MSRQWTEADAAIVAKAHDLEWQPRNRVETHLDRDKAQNHEGFHSRRDLNSSAHSRSCPLATGQADHHAPNLYVLVYDDRGKSIRLRDQPHSVAAPGIDGWTMVFMRGTSAYICHGTPVMSYFAEPLRFEEQIVPQVAEGRMAQRMTPGSRPRALIRAFSAKLLPGCANR